MRQKARLLKVKTSEPVPVRFAVHLLDEALLAWLADAVQKELAALHKARRRKRYKHLKKYKQLVYLADAIKILNEARFK